VLIYDAGGALDNCENVDIIVSSLSRKNSFD